MVNCIKSEYSDFEFDEEKFAEGENDIDRGQRKVDTLSLPKNRHGIPVDRSNYEKRIPRSKKVGISRRKASPGKKAKVFLKTDGRCAYCGISLNRRTGKTIDHITPLATGGKHDVKNLLPACKECNNQKSDLSLREFRKRLSRVSGDKVVFYFEGGEPYFRAKNNQTLC